MEFVKTEDSSWLKPEGLQVRPETASNLSWEEAGCFGRTWKTNTDLKALDGIGRVSNPSSPPARGQKPCHDLEPFIIWAVV